MGSEDDDSLHGHLIPCNFHVDHFGQHQRIGTGCGLHSTKPATRKSRECMNTVVLSRNALLQLYCSNGCKR